MTVPVYIAAMTIRVLLALLALGFCLQAEAKDGSGIVYGWGNHSCGAWTKAEANRPPINAVGTMYVKIDSDIAAQTQWISGFISAFNLYQSVTPDVTKDTDMNGVLAWIDNCCAAHPLDQIATAAIALMHELSQ